ncbi:hypothetical protein BOO71_0010246 [Deinococcus marmoris]|uniref:Uncharacterized protein n=1 Tax=Deinococcus marmoris TaxID=249408 RepID=A0A1U7NVL6_9DEIO|nr:hypothetical protein BOO71_0010246 [Deinococcus marmoris]
MTQRKFWLVQELSWAVLVRDDGVGIKPQYGDRMFTVR